MPLGPCLCPFPDSRFTVLGKSKNSRICRNSQQLSEYKNLSINEHKQPGIERNGQLGNRWHSSLAHCRPLGLTSQFRSSFRWESIRSIKWISCKRSKSGRSMLQLVRSCSTHMQWINNVAHGLNWCSFCEPSSVFPCGFPVFMVRHSWFCWTTYALGPDSLGHTQAIPCS